MRPTVLLIQMLTSSVVQGKVFPCWQYFPESTKRLNKFQDAFVLSVYLTTTPNFKQSQLGEG